VNVNSDIVLNMVMNKVVHMVWYGVVWRWYGMICDVIEWSGDGIELYGMIWYGMVLNGMRWYGMV
jgi:hypothetical protein